jgi:hypothetical protein
MPIISRRVSLLLLAISFFLVLAPSLFPPPIGAQETITGEVRSLVPTAIQWGVGGAMFIVWLYQFRKGKASDEATLALFTSQLVSQNETTKLAFDKYNESTQQLIGMLKTNQEQGIQIQKDSQETTSLLTGTLSRLEVKLAQPVQCPLLDRRNFPNQGA